MPSLPYTAANTAKGVGAIQVKDVTYVLAESGMVTPSQLFHSNSRFVINMPEPIADYVRQALAAELQRSGFSTEGNAPLLLSCKVTRLGIHQFALGIDSVFAGELSLSRQDGTLIFKGPVDLKRNHGLGTSLKGVRKDFDSMIAEAYDRLMAAGPVKAVLTAP